MSTTISLSMESIVSAAREQVSSDLAGEVVILNLNAGVYHGLDAVGARIWNMLQEPRCVDEIRNAILADYDVDAQTCERDLLEILESLCNHGLLQVHSSTI